MSTRAVAAGAALVFLLAGFITLGYPAVFKVALAEPSMQTDAAEGKVRLDSPVVIELRGSPSEEEVRESLEVRPPVAIDEAELRLERVALFPWHEGLPWAKTRVTINAEGARVFRPETSYTVRVGDATATFETIALPRVLEADVTPATRDDSGRVPTSSDIVLRFNEEIEWQDEWLSVDPPVRVTTTTRETPDGATEVVVKAGERWENGTTYTVNVPSGIRDVEGHRSERPYSYTFSTWPNPVVTNATPTGNHLSPESVVRVVFDRAMDHASVERSFAVTPAAKGTFVWDGDRSFDWRAPLAHSTLYTLSVGGTSIEGDPLPAYEWSFATHDSPIKLAIEGEKTSPTTLKAAVSGGTGKYAIKWSTGATTQEIGVDLWFESVRTYSVTVTSGDQSASAELRVSGPPSPCPEDWRIINVAVCYTEETLPGPVQVYTARVNLRDPGISLASLPAGDFLGAASPVSESTPAEDAVLAVNGDFFGTRSGGVYTSGPMVSEGSFVRAAQSGRVVLGIDGKLRSWAGPAQTLDLYARARDGNTHPLVAVNDGVGLDQLALYNAYKGSSVSVPSDGCAAVYAPRKAGATTPRAFACGARNVRLALGEFVLLGRGTAADWLLSYSAEPLAIESSFSLPDVQFAVGGSHVLISEGEATDASGLAGAAHPRTAIGVDGDGYLYLTVVDGRSGESAGMTLVELQSYLSRFDLVSAINLDGGGSSTLVLKGAVMNTPSDGNERAVAGIVAVQPSQEGCRHPFVRCR